VSSDTYHVVFFRRLPQYSPTSLSPFPSNSPAMSTNNSGTADSGTGLESTEHSQEACVDTGPKKDIRQTGPDAGACVGSSATSLFHTAGLSQALQTLRYEGTYLISLPTEYLWESYLLEDQVLTNVRQHLITESWLTGDGAWNPEKIDRDQFDVGRDAFDFFPRLFNMVMGYLQRTGPKTPLVKTMMHSGNGGPESTRDSTYKPDAFLYVTTDPTSMPDKFRWRDLTCPFEYKFDDGYPVNVSQPESIARQDHIFILRRTTTGRCGTSLTSCVLTLVGRFRLDAPYKAQSSASGCCAERLPSRLPPLTGSMSVQVSCFRCKHI